MFIHFTVSCRYLRLYSFFFIVFFFLLLRLDTFNSFICKLWGSAGKESACSAGGLGSIPGWERSPGEGKGYPLQCSDLENSMDCIVHGDAKSRTRLSDFHFTVEYKNYKTSNCNAVHLKYIVIIIDRQNKWMVMEIPPMCGAVGIDWEGRSEF